MKLKISFVVVLFMTLIKSYGQSPQSFNYQAVARDNSGNVISNQSIALRISIVDSSASGNVLYTETISTATNDFGLININVGTGVVVSGTFSSINWNKNNKWLKVETDFAGGTNYQLMGSSQLLSVPYSLYAEKSGFSYSSNNPVIVSMLGDTVFIGNTYLLIPGVSMANACRMDFADTIPYSFNYPHAGDNPYDADLYGLPKFIRKNYIEIDKIDSISRFRSGVGHDYSDSFESCRSMKHYFKPRQNIDWAEVKIFSPVNGIVTDTFAETIGGSQVWIMPLGMPAFRIIIFHVDLGTPLVIGDSVFSGQQLGVHTGYQTFSDIAVQIYTPGSTFKRVSFFEVMTDKLFTCFMSRGVDSIDEFIILRQDRDVDPLLPCNGQQFFVTGTINNWISIN